MLVTNEIFINSVLSTANKSAKQILQQDSGLQAPKLQRPAVGSQENKRGKASSVTSTMSFPGISWKELQGKKKNEMIQLPKLWVYGSRAVQDSIRK